MNKRLDDKLLELILVLSTTLLGLMLYWIEQSQVVVLNLFFLPVVLAGFFLGCYRAGVLALLSVVIATLVITMDLDRFAISQSANVIGLSVMVWGAVLGLTAIIVGTLNEERNTRTSELHEAHVGVVEVLVRCLQSADPAMQSRASRVDTLAEQVGIRMRLSPREIDEIRVAALLMDLSRIEITARVIKRAVGDLERNQDRGESTLNGNELVNSLGSVLSGAFPLVLIQSSSWNEMANHALPIGARVLRIVRRFVELSQTGISCTRMSESEAVEDIRQDLEHSHDRVVLNILEDVISSDSTERKPSTDISRKRQYSLSHANG